MKSRYIATCAFFLVLGFAANAQQNLILQNRPALTRADLQGVEVEVIEIRQGGAIPAEIRRPAGKFILVLVNRSPEPAASFAVDPADVGEGRIGPNPLLRLTDQGTPSLKHKVAGLAELPQGEFHLKSASTGKVLCHIRID